jgi:hypothetical protein
MDLVSIQNEAIDAELLECQGCKRVYQIMYESDGETPRLVAV